MEKYLYCAICFTGVQNGLKVFCIEEERKYLIYRENTKDI